METCKLKYTPHTGLLRTVRTHDTWLCMNEFTIFLCLTVPTQTHVNLCLVNNHNLPIKRSGSSSDLKEGYVGEVQLEYRTAPNFAQLRNCSQSTTTRIFDTSRLDKKKKVNLVTIYTHLPWSFPTTRHRRRG